SLLLHSKRSRRRGRGLVEQQGHGLRLLGLRDQHGVAPQHHRLVLQLVAVDPGEDARQARVGHAIGDPVQQVEVARPAQAGSAGAPLLQHNFPFYLVSTALRAEEPAAYKSYYA
uniref:Uncharacterized protein n=1 Tax=Melopsittacus undulatus TaxID=13146 RepID=A0A8C6JKT4_MELUD